jgi:hypothetical protein
MSKLYEQLKRAYEEERRIEEKNKRDNTDKYSNMIKNKLINKINKITINYYNQGEYTLLSFKCHDYFRGMSLFDRCSILQNVIDNNTFNMPVKYDDLYKDHEYIGC